MVNLELSNNLHRDGIIGTAEQQGSETLAATTAHTRMALRILDDGKKDQIQMTENLAMDITAYKLSQGLGNDSLFAGYVAGNYDSTWGLNGAQFSNNSMRVYLSNHLDSNSLMNYLSVFGMDGTRISQLQNGQYSLEGVKAGVMYATMGQTGISGGAHIDFGIYEVNNKNILSMYRDNNLNFESVYSNVYEKLNMEYDVKAYSGLSSKRWDIDERAKEVRVYMHDVLINSWNDTYKPILEVLQFLN